MANILEKAISILAGYLNLGRSYLITTVCNIRNRRQATKDIRQKIKTHLQK